MAKYDLIIESRHIYFGPEERNISELYSVNGSCEFGDDCEANNDFDVELRSDAYRHIQSVAYDTAESAYSGEKGSNISGGRISDTEFELAVPTWTADELIGYRVWAENTLVAGSGAWFDVTDNTATVLTISGTLPDFSNRINLQARAKIRHNIQIVPQPGFYGSFMKYKVTKKVPVDGNFKWFGVSGEAIPTNLDPEFFAGAGISSAGWES